MGTPSAKYAVDYTDSLGLKWSKALNVIYPNLGVIDESIGYSRYNSNIVKNIYRKVSSYMNLYDNSYTFASDFTSPYVWKYFSRSGTPVDAVNINTIIVNDNNEDSDYVIGVDSESSNPYGALASGRILVDANINNILIKSPGIRRFKNFTAGTSIIQGYAWEYSNGSNWEDTDLEHLNDNDYCAIYYSYGAKVWNGSSWSDTTLRPALLCSGDTVQSVQGAGSAFINTYATGNMKLGTGENVSVTANTNSAFWNGYNFQNRMLSWRYSLGFTDEIEFKPDFAADTDAKKADIKNYLINNCSPNTNINLSLERKIIEKDTHLIVLLEIYGQFYYDNSQNVYCNWLSYNATPCIKGKSLSSFIAGFGLYYLSDNSASLSGITPANLGDSNKIWLGEMSADGTTTGNWIKGSDIDSYTGYNKDGNIINPGYDPSGGGGSGGDEDNKDPINVTGAPFAAGLCNYYAMTAGSPLLDHISEALGTWDIENTHKDLYKNLISCKLIKPPAPIPTSGSAPFTIYGVKPQYSGADISLPVVSGNPTATFGPYSVPRKFGDFRDYAPYTRVSIYLPYCGWCDLPSHVVGKSVSVKYFTDIIAATCKAVVFCGNNIIAEAAGVIGLDIPFVADNVGAKMQAVTAGMISALGGGIQLGAGIGTMVSTKSGNGAKAALSGASQYLSGYSQMAMAFNENTTEISGKNGDGCCLSGAANIIIKIVRPKKGAYTDSPYTPPGYGHNVGYVSQKQVRVGNVSGLLIADNVDTSGIAGATEAERAEIKRVLETGLIVNAAPNTGE